MPVPVPGPIDPRIARAFEQENGFELEPHLLVLALMGSHSHGTYLPPEDPDAVDDVDLMGFVVPPREYHLGLPRWEHWVFQFEELDVVLYSLEKAFRLLLKSNPNIVGTLWLRRDEYLFQHPLFAELRAQRAIFASRQAAEAFAGYATSQLKRMEAFDIERMDEYESLTRAIVHHGAPADVVTADRNRIEHLSRTWGIALETLTRFQALHRKYFSGYMAKSARRWSASTTTT